VLFTPGQAEPVSQFPHVSIWGRSTFCRMNNLSLEQLDVWRMKNKYAEYGPYENNGQKSDSIDMS
jgi:hypothetical protein